MTPLLSDDPLLTATGVKASWGINEWELRRLVMEGKVRRVRYRGGRAYYPLSAVVSILGEPPNGVNPGKPSGYELERAA